MGDEGGERGRATLGDVFAVLRDPHLEPAAKVLWGLYRSYESADRGAFPGDELLAQHLGLSERSVQQYRYALIEAGYLQQRLRGRKPALYRAVLPDGAEAPAGDDGDQQDEDGDDWPSPSEAVGGNYPQEFKDAWGEYPAREGSNSKKAAYRKWLARVRNGADPSQLEEATRAYKRRMEREDKVGGPFVKQAATFFGPDDHWREELDMAASRNGEGTDLERQRAALDVLDGGQS